MSKRTFIWFGVLVLVLAVVIPFAAFRAKGDGETGEDKVPSSLEGAQSLFVTNCGTCHALYSAGTDGNYAPDLDWTETAPREESLEFLLDLPGVGRKTAACVLIFTWGIPEIPVDVHVHRVGGRLGLFPAKASFERAHDEMLAITDPEDAYELHINLITHGRRVCRPQPRCEECGLRRMCPWYRRHRAGPGTR